MIQCQLKLRPCKRQERELERWLFHLGSVYNWAVRKIELNAKDRIFFSQWEFQNLLAGHSRRLDIPCVVLQGVLRTVHGAWSKCFKKKGGRPHLKGARNRLVSIPLPSRIKPAKGSRIYLPGLETIRFHKMDIPAGDIKCGRIIKRASGWYLCLFIDADPTPVQRAAFGSIGIDPGFSNLLTLSSGEVIAHPREAEHLQSRLAQSQRGRNAKLTNRIRERLANQRKDRNHKISHRLIAENVKIVFSKDPTASIAKRFGKSVASSAHSQLRHFLAYKSPKSGTQYVEVGHRFSTKTCNQCGSKTGPSGIAGLSVRNWVCSACGAHLDRDINAAINTLNFGAGCAHGNQKPAFPAGHHGTGGEAL